MTPPDPPTRFLRAHDDRVFGGVAGGLGRAFGVDAIIFRIVLAALVLAGGVGLVAYGAAMLLVPVDDGTGHPAPRERTWRTVAATAGGGLLLLAVFAAIDGSAWDADWLVLVAIIAGLGWLVVRRRGGSLREREPWVRALVAFGVGLALLAGAGLLFWGSAWVTAAGGGVVVASVVLALGAVLVVAAFRGGSRARWLAVPALLLALPAGVVSAADVSLDGGVGDRTHRPTGADRLPTGYRLGAGELVVDLRDLDWSDGRRVALDVGLGVGHAVVIVPEEVCVGARTDVGAGYADVFGRDAAGVDVTHDVERTPAPGGPGLTLDVELGMGAFEVLHRPDDSDIGQDRRFDDDRFFESREDRERRETGRIADRACAGGTA